MNEYYTNSVLTNGRQANHTSWTAAKDDSV